jgi:ribose transport system substrate-binding protein
VLLIELPEAGSFPQLRLDGAMDGIKEMIPSLQEQQFVHINGQNDFEHSYSSVRRWLRKITVGNCLIAAINDPSALGAIAAFRQLQPAGQCVAVGQNATPAARLEMRKRGSPLIGSVAYQPERYGAEVMRMAIHLARQLPVPPALYARHRLVNAANVDRLFPEDRERR